MPRDVFITLHRCRYCDRPGSVVWDGDLVTCGREVCESLAYAELQRRRRHARRHASERARAHVAA